MDGLTLRLSPRAAFGTPLMGDTLFGQICWAIRNRFGEARLTGLLTGYVENRPFAVVSDALPAGHVPRPVIPLSQLKDVGPNDRKEAKKRRWLLLEALNDPGHWVQWAVTCPEGDVHTQPHNRKKHPVTVNGQEVLSQAEQGNLQQLLETIPPMRFRAFTGRLTLQRVKDGPSTDGKLPDTSLRWTLDQIAEACNRFYWPKLEGELNTLRSRGFLEEEWAAAMHSLVLGGFKERLDTKRALLLRVGRHSGAEAVTLDGVRSSKIMEGRDPQTGQQRSSYQPTPKTAWLSAAEQADRRNLLPFGWIVIEVAPYPSHCEAWPEAEAAMAGYNARFAAWSSDLKRRRAAAVVQRGEEQARLAQERAHIEAEAQVAREREARLAAMTLEQQAVEAFRDYYLGQKQRGRYQPGSKFDEKRLAFFKEALGWSDTAARQAAAALLRETIKDWTDWPGKKERKAEFRNWLEQLGG